VGDAAFCQPTLACCARLDVRYWRRAGADEQQGWIGDSNELFRFGWAVWALCAGFGLL